MHVDCPTQRSKLELLDASAWVDARYDQRIHRIALSILLPTATPGRRVDVREACERLLEAVTARSRWIGEGAETIRDSYETWELAAGDCDDVSRLLLALARSIGLNARLAYFDAAPPGSEDISPYHASVQLFDGARWRWAECSVGAGVVLGEHPRAARSRLGTVAADLGGVELHPAATTVGPIGPTPGPGPVDRHIWGRKVLEQAWATFDELPQPAPARALQIIASVSVGAEKSNYGLGGYSTPEMNAANNWGAVQCSKGAPCPSETCIPYKDTTTSGTPYEQCFRRYPSPMAGAADLIRHMTIHRPTVLAALEEGSYLDVSRAMRESSYFGGFCPGVDHDNPGASKQADTAHPTTELGIACADEAIFRYAQAMHTGGAKIALALGEPLVPLEGSSSSSLPWVVGGVALVIAAGAGYYYRDELAEAWRARPWP